MFVMIPMEVDPSFCIGTFVDDDKLAKALFHSSSSLRVPRHYSSTDDFGLDFMVQNVSAAFKSDVK